MRAIIENSRKALANKKAQAAALAAAGMSQAHAALDTAAVQTGLNAAVSTGETVGGYVVIGVATLVVIGLVIGIVKKL